ncbi:MAG: bifunctional adenosylcobinamide kinase/adenosylcobinamide-phosphate guanylyltransferase [Hyphomicrobiaceae bacterium]|nr:bifunctional adenosylcobinamide kinase/adenosylcobinamide-phosphate guanylyltransferase [Hyphomicrobiaceae bacterium]
MAETGVVFVTGGARSGKSSFALRRATMAGGDAVTFIATAEALDAEMADRIDRHRMERSPAWQTVEAPRDLETALTAARSPVVIVDCLSLWVSNLMLDGLTEAEIVARSKCLTPFANGALVIAVTNEVGLSIVPDNALARAYRDCLGRVNQAVAAASTEAHLLVAGLALRLK